MGQNIIHGNRKKTWNTQRASSRNTTRTDFEELVTPPRALRGGAVLHPIFYTIVISGIF
jgi:hypothetical protein